METPSDSVVTQKPTTSAPPSYKPTTSSSPPNKPAATSEQSETDSMDSVGIDADPNVPQIPPIGECSERMFIAHKQDCSKYLICNFGQIQEFKCPNGLYWNEDHCDWPENSKCKSKHSRS